MCALMFYLFFCVFQEKVDEQQTKAEESKAVNDKSNSSASAKDTDSSDCSEDESSDEDGDTKNDSDDSEVPGARDVVQHTDLSLLYVQQNMFAFSKIFYIINL